MATVERDAPSARTGRPPLAAREESAGTGKQLHRVATVRQQQGVSLRSAARQLGTDVRQLRQQEGENTDLRLSQLLEWQRVLEVPMVDLLVEPGTPLSRPVMERARLVRLMKTVMAIREHETSAQVRRLAQTMIDQLVEIMPELKDVGPWHSVGQRRSLDEYGIAAERSISEDFFHRGKHDRCLDVVHTFAMFTNSIHQVSKRGSFQHVSLNISNLLPSFQQHARGWRQIVRIAGQLAWLSFNQAHHVP